jgi:Raf kinase inhibitor-like YbhB/YbcL family protein
MPRSAVASPGSIGALVALAAIVLLVTLAVLPREAAATTGKAVIRTGAASGAATIDAALPDALSGATTVTAIAADLVTGDSSPFSEPATALREVPLAQGWNLVGWTGATPVRDATESLADSLLAAFTWDPSGQAFRSFSPSAPDFINTLDEMALGDGVWANLSQAATWLQPPFVEARAVPLAIGFNLVMWTGPDDIPVADAVVAIASSLDGLFMWDAGAQQFLTYRPTALAFLNTATTLRYGDGVWLRMTQSATWSQPALDGELPAPPPIVEDPLPFALISSAFAANALIPAVYTCDGANTSPPLTLSGLPADTATLALIVDDPDAPGGIWVHWVAFNIPPATTIAADVGALGTSGRNSWDLPGYGGPCPPSGTHRYVFTVYALDAELVLDEGVTEEELVAAMDGHVLGTAELIGLFR